MYPLLEIRFALVAERTAAGSQSSVFRVASWMHRKVVPVRRNVSQATKPTELSQTKSTATASGISVVPHSLRIEPKASRNTSSIGGDENRVCRYLLRSGLVRMLFCSCRKRQIWFGKPKSFRRRKLWSFAFCKNDPHDEQRTLGVHLVRLCGSAIDEPLRSNTLRSGSCRTINNIYR
jgi:hypothetical protein